MSAQADSPLDRLALRVDDDGLAAWIRIAAGPAAERAVLDELLREAGVVAGLDEAALCEVAARLATEAGDETAVCVARGQAARDGVPAVLELCEPLGPTSGRLREDESLDYRERGLIVPVSQGDVIGRISSEIAPQNGFDVRGHELVGKPAPALAFAHGDGVERDAQDVLRATRSGARTLDKQGLLDVVLLHVHAGAVDLASGNLATEGSLSVAKDVKGGMRIQARADLEVRGTVEDARLEAGGSIEIRGGVLGGEQGSVHAGGDVSLRHALGARIEAGGVLRVTRGVSTSSLQAREIEIGGVMLGDVARAETRIRVRDAGSPAGGPCHLRAAHPLGRDELETGGARTPEDAARARARARLRAESERLSARKSRATGDGRGERAHVQAPAEIAQQRQFRARQRALQASARIEITGTAHAGCRIDFGGRPLVLEESVKARTYRYDVEGDLVLAEEP